MWLAKVETLGRSFSLYAPVVLVSKVLVYARVFLLTWLIGADQYGIWGLGVAVFGIGSTIITLGTNQSVARYVSYYQARGRLGEFFRRAAVGILLVSLALTALGVLASGRLADALALSSEARQQLAWAQRHQIVLAGLANALLVALYLNLDACIRAMRTFRLLAALEVGYTLLFTAGALSAAAVTRSGLVILYVHAACLAVMLVAGGYAAKRCLAFVAALPAQAHDSIGVEGEVLPPARPLANGEAGDDAGRPVLVKLLRFGVVAMLSTLAFQLGNYVSRLLLLNRSAEGLKEAGVYSALQQFCQPAWILAGMVWGVVFSHLASHWESNRRVEAMRTADLTYKAAVLALMSVSVLLLATGRWWRLLMQQDYQGNIATLGGLLMFYQCSANLGLATMASNLRERPVVIAVIIAAAVVVNAALSWVWIPSAGAVGAARAAGLGMLLAVAVGVVYLIATGFRVHPAAHALALSPVVLLAPPAVVVVVWAIVLALAAATPAVFTAREKRMLIDYVRSAGATWRRRQG